MRSVPSCEADTTSEVFWSTVIAVTGPAGELSVILAHHSLRRHSWDSVNPGGKAQDEREGLQELPGCGTPVWPTNTIWICQSASHTFTVLSREAVTMASTSSQYSRSEMMLDVREWEAKRTQHSHVCGSYSP